MATCEFIPPTGIDDKEVLPRPSLPVLNTAELIEAMGSEWKMPTTEEVRNKGLSQILLSTNFEGLIVRWINFLDLAEKGNNIVKKTAEQGVIEADVLALGAWVYAKEILGDSDQRKEMMEGAKRAFRVLLGEEEEMKPGDSEQARELVRIFEEHLISTSSITPEDSKI